MKRVYYSVLCLAALAVVACNKEGAQTTGETLCANAYISSDATRTVYEVGNYGDKTGAKVSWDTAESFRAYYDGGTAKLPQVLRLLQSPFRKVFPYLLHLQACTALLPH